MKPFAFGLLLLILGCASLRRGPIDQAVVKDLVCSGREGEAREYIIGLKYPLPAVTERVERARKECQ